MINKIQSKILEIKSLTKDIKQISLKIPKNFTFKSGQYILLELPVKDSIQRRAYSIASAPNKKEKIELCIKISKESLFLSELNKLKKYKEISFIGPAGKFKLNEKSKKDLVFISVGTGIAPIKSMIEDELKNKNSDKKINIIHGYRHKEDILYKNFFTKLEKKFPNFEQNIVLSKPRKRYHLKGHVQDFLKDLIKNPKQKNYYLCGMKDMISEVSETLKKLGVKENQINFEKYN